MFTSVIGALVQPVVLASSISASVEAATALLASQQVPVPVTAVKPAPQAETTEVAKPGLQLSEYMTPAGMDALCDALVKAFVRDGSSAEVIGALRQCVKAPVSAAAPGADNVTPASIL
ncbi:hypothetical protein H8F21_16175 [Pseudomonas sp. P66]|uniref:Secreted protein n=1 Tax=Pseudomonas arcuscaelestis TaxID=2710591 RepID=A0ABS2BZQ3_9PSED|nr:hypothetical protein [Pseudomonas arcuscaelestis]MBM5459106.1 hypothetical protein [Pseudomonas arcuscaelestis]